MEMSRFQNSWSVRNLPDDIFPEILSNLPVKYLLRFRSVSPSWRSLIDSPDFARLHLNRSPKNLLLCSTAEDAGECVLKGSEIRCSQTLKLTATLDPRPLIDPSPIAVIDWSVVSSIDGLVMISASLAYIGESTRFILWNPSIRKSRKLPFPPQILSNEMWEIEFGFGFDPSINDYKYVRLVKNQEDHVLFVQVYTVGTNSWRSVSAEGCSCFVNIYGDLRSYCRRGVLYTLASDQKIGPLGLVSFDLSTEVFASTKLPVEDHTGHSRIFCNQTLVMMNGEDSLVFIDGLGSDSCTVWVTEKLAADFRSLIWTQRYNFTAQIPEDGLSFLLNGISSFLYLKKNGEMLVNCNDMVTSYNLETGEEKIVLEDFSLYGQNNTWSFIESLVWY